MLSSVLAVALAVAAAWWSWRQRLARPLARAAMLARAIGLSALLILLLDPGIAARGATRRPLVLLDNSISMHAATGRAGEAASIAAAIGDTMHFGELMRGEPGGRSDLFAPLSGAVNAGRAVTVVTDGEISDAAAIPADLLAQATVRVLARRPGADIALTGVRASDRLAAGDSLVIDVEGRRTPGAPDTAAIEVRDSAAVLMRGVLDFNGGRYAHLRLAVALPPALHGERWLRVERVGPSDAEPDDDVRWLRVVVAPTPGIVVVADAPDWDSRALYRALKDVVDAPIRGYAQLQRGQWRRMDDLRAVPAAEVIAAARNADLLAVRGDVKDWRTMGRARLLWPDGTQGGDWYLAAGGISPIAGAFVGVEPDSLPPTPAIEPLDRSAANGWIGATARLARRGAPIPVIGGTDDRAGRTVTFGADGLYRWSLRGGLADQVWRTLMSNVATWLLATPQRDSVRARVVAAVNQRGLPVHFRWSGVGDPIPVAIDVQGPGTRRTDTLRFDGTGDATLALPVGRYQYVMAHGGAGTFAVEPYADELVPSPVTLAEHTGRAVPPASRQSLRDLVWLFAVAIAAFGAEWMLRRRLGLR